MKLQVVSNRKLYIQIADQIRDRILAGDAGPGDQLPSERDLATTLGVSRPTVREALIALEVAGLVEVRVGVGAFVRRAAGKTRSLPEKSRSPTEIMAVRRLLEPEAAALASQHIDDAGKDRLREIVQQMQAETEEGLWSTESDRALHVTVADYAGNTLLRDVLDQLWVMRAEEMDKRMHQHLATIGAVRERILADHERIVAEITRGDSAAAREAMIRHLDFVSTAMTDTWE